MRLHELLVLMLEVVARLTGPLLEDRLARLALRLLPDLPALQDHWTLEFDDPTRSGGSRKMRVHVELRQFGRKVRGTGHLVRRPQDSFAFEGKIRRNVFFGAFQRNDPHLLAGTGTFVLKIVAHSRAMEGHCLWYDGVLDKVWASAYRWMRHVD